MRAPDLMRAQHDVVGRYHGVPRHRPAGVSMSTLVTPHLDKVAHKVDVRVEAYALLLHDDYPPFSLE